MKTWKIITTLTLVIAAAALIATSAYGYMGGFRTNPYNTYTGTTSTYGGFGGMMGGGMMGGYGDYNTYPQTTTPTTTTPATPYYGNGIGDCGGMRYRFGYAAPPAYSTGTPLNITTAVTLAQNYLAQIGNPNLAIAHVEEYTYNFYVQIRETDTGIGAFELVVDKYTGSIGPEMGPNRMWNTKYGMHSGVMGWLTVTPTTQMTISVDQARSNAQQYLNSYYPGTTVGEVETFYGYYHVMALSAGEGYGMLSVNGYTGEVWFHTWHGSFIQEIEP